MQQTHENEKEDTAARQRPTLQYRGGIRFGAEVSIEWLHRLKSGVNDSPYANDSLSVVQRGCRIYAEKCRRSMKTPERAGFRNMAGCYLFLLICPTPRLMLGRYYSGRYDILSGLQIHKFSETRSIEWDPQGQQRLVAHYVLNDICVTPPGGEKVLVKRASMFICSNYHVSLIFTDAGTRIFCPPYCLSIVVSPATPSQGCTVITILTRAKG